MRKSIYSCARRIATVVINAREWAVRRLLFFICGFLPARVIWAEPEDGVGQNQPLFERYLVGVLPNGTVIYLHHYLRSDPDRGPHDHPWPWAVSVPLAGGYWEERLAGFMATGMRLITRRRRPFMPYRLTGADFHRVLISGKSTSWSLFIHGRFTKGWGFLRGIGVLTRSDKPDPTGPVVAYHPFKEDNSGTSHWWESAPRGRQIERAAP